MEEIARSEREASETKRQAAASIEKVKQEETSDYTGTGGMSEIA